MSLPDGQVSGMVGLRDAAVRSAPGAIRRPPQGLSRRRQGQAWAVAWTLAGDVVPCRWRDRATPGRRDGTKALLLLGQGQRHTLPHNMTAEDPDDGL